MGLFNFLMGKEYTDIDSATLREMLLEKDKYQFVDVRTKQEYKHGHIKGFNKNIDYYKFVRNQSMLDRISKDKPVVVMCQTGSRSAGTAHLLTKRGYKDVYNYRKGIRIWDGALTKK